MSQLLGSKTYVASDGSVPVLGVTDGSNAAAGYVGELVTSSVVSASTTGTASNLTSITLTAGDWNITELISCSSGGTATYMRHGISATSATFTGQEGKDFMYSPFAGATMSGAIPMYPVRISATTTYYLVALSQANITGQVFGTISARRVR